MGLGSLGLFILGFVLGFYFFVGVLNIFFCLFVGMLRSVLRVGIHRQEKDQQ